MCILHWNDFESSTHEKVSRVSTFHDLLDIPDVSDIALNFFEHVLMGLHDWFFKVFSFMLYTIASKFLTFIDL